MSSAVESALRDMTPQQLEELFALNLLASRTPERLVAEVLVAPASKRPKRKGFRTALRCGLVLGGVAAAVLVHVLR